MENKNDKSKDEAKAGADEQNDNMTRIAYISQKTQRLAGALYAITKVFPHQEPLKTTLRNQALSLVSSAHMMSEGTPSTDSVIELPSLLNRLRSQLAVARDGGLISAMNFSVLDEEIEQFITEIDEVGAFPGPHLSSALFSGEENPALTAGRPGRNISAGSSSSVSERGGEEGSPSSISSGRKSKGKQALSAKDKRRQKILDLFDDKSEITVNDVTEVVNGYSTKTIQRDLKALVKNGQLEKHGKRRWTSYTRA